MKNKKQPDRTESLVLFLVCSTQFIIPMMINVIKREKKKGSLYLTPDWNNQVWEESF